MAPSGAPEWYNHQVVQVVGWKFLVEMFWVCGHCRPMYWNISFPVGYNTAVNLKLQLLRFWSDT